MWSLLRVKDGFMGEIPFWIRTCESRCVCTRWTPPQLTLSFHQIYMSYKLRSVIASQCTQLLERHLDSLEVNQMMDCVKNYMPASTRYTQMLDDALSLSARANGARVLVPLFLYPPICLTEGRESTSGDYCLARYRDV